MTLEPDVKCERNWSILAGMTRMQRSWALAKASWDVLKSEKGLLWLPVLSFLASLVVLGVFSLAIWATVGKDTGVGGQNEYSTNVATWVLAACMYVGMAFSQTYFLAALCAGANERLQGRDSTIGTALAVANSRLHRILPWAIVSATVSVIVQAIEERFGFLGQIIGGLVGAAWNVVTFLTIPIIVFEDVGPITALKRSGTLLKKTWGENLMAQIGLGIIGMLAFIPGILVLALGFSSGVGVVVVLAVGDRRHLPRDRRVRALRAERHLPHGAVPLRGGRSGARGVRQHGHGARLRGPQGEPRRLRRRIRRHLRLTQLARQRRREVRRSRRAVAAASGATGLPSVPLPTSPDAR